jgi:hypothetical protein
MAEQPPHCFDIPASTEAGRAEEVPELAEPPRRLDAEAPLQPSPSSAHGLLVQRLPLLVYDEPRHRGLAHAGFREDRREHRRYGHRPLIAALGDAHFVGAEGTTYEEASPVEVYVAGLERAHLAAAKARERCERK